MASICAALVLGKRVVDEAEKDLPANQRPSLISLNGRAVRNSTWKKHASMFPDSRLRLLSYVLMGAFFVSLLATACLASRVFGQ
jgi:hypothetical protein